MKQHKFRRNFVVLTLFIASITLITIKYTGLSVNSLEKISSQSWETIKRNRLQFLQIKPPYALSNNQTSSKIVKLVKVDADRTQKPLNNSKVTVVKRVLAQFSPSRGDPRGRIECGDYKCMMDYTTAWDTKDADIVVFEGRSMGRDPPKRHKDQLWLFKFGEAQYYLSARDPMRWDGLFNYSETFVRESQKFLKGCGFSYQRRFEKLELPTKRNFANEKKIMANSTVNALWFVSHCILSGFFRVRSGRAEYAKELSKHINVDIISRQSECSGVLHDLIKVRPKQEPEYKHYWFYLSFENSLCRDYVTEKMWKILEDKDSLAIPIVLGGLHRDDYEITAPPNSFIDVRNFTSPAHLAKHLRHVVENEEAFNYYQEWRNKYYITHQAPEFCSNSKGEGDWICHACKLAHNRPNRIWNSISKDFTGADCIDLSDPLKAKEYYGMNKN